MSKDVEQLEQAIAKMTDEKYNTGDAKIDRLLLINREFGFTAGYNSRNAEIAELKEYIDTLRNYIHESRRENE